MIEEKTFENIKQWLEEYEQLHLPYEGDEKTFEGKACIIFNQILHDLCEDINENL